MSRSRQAVGPAIRTSAVVFPSAYTLHWQAMDWAQLIYALHGVMTVHASGGLWVIPPYQAMWVPAGHALRVEMGGRVSMRTLYFHTSLRSGLPATCRVVRVSPLLRELLLHAVRLRTLDTRERSERHLIDVLLDQLAILPVAPLDLPMPRDPRAARAAARARATPHARLRLAELAKEAGASPRTLERLFRAETGLAVGAWHQRARMLRALELLAAGEQVTRTSLSLGYESPSAFVAAFRRSFGTTPGRYFSSHRPGRARPGPRSSSTRRP
jgi:AraC-like DNA-binding protein